MKLEEVVKGLREKIERGRVAMGWDRVDVRSTEETELLLEGERGLVHLVTFRAWRGSEWWEVCLVIRKEDLEKVDREQIAEAGRVVKGALEEGLKKIAVA